MISSTSKCSLVSTAHSNFSPRPEAFIFLESPALVLDSECTELRSFPSPEYCIYEQAIS